MADQDSSARTPRALTYTHHEQTIRGAHRAERNMLRAVEGGTDTLDRHTLTTLQQVLA